MGLRMEHTTFYRKYVAIHEQKLGSFRISIQNDMKWALRSANILASKRYNFVEHLNYLKRKLYCIDVLLLPFSDFQTKLK